MKRGTVLPLNYQYPISSWVYKCINRADSEFADFLHEQGFRGARAGKPFKFFTFSKLEVPKRELYEDRIIVQSQEVFLTVAFLVEKAAEKFVTGVFQQQHVGIGDHKSQMDFEVGQIEARPVDIQEEMLIKTVSPIVMSAPELVHGKMKAKFLSPQDAGYPDLLLQNLIRKYEAYATYTGNSVSPIITKELTWELQNGMIRSSLETIKANTPQQTKVRGYSYTFKISGPIPILRIGMLAGFGEKNSLGFGCGEVMIRNTLNR